MAGSRDGGRARSPAPRNNAAPQGAARVGRLKRPSAAPQRAAHGGTPALRASATPEHQVRRVQATDLAGIIALDERVTGLAKPDYWRDAFERYGRRRPNERMFLVAQSGRAQTPAPILGFILGEVRAWEFGSGPCGWVIALSVEPGKRLRGCGEALLQALAAHFKRAGVGKMRTMVARDNRLHLLFFRSEGMMAGPYVELEKELD
jgi:ribosomal protein S18 acetylase RimI-like enzyme